MGPDALERADVLRPLAERALERYDLPSPRLVLITNDWNCVFRVDAADGSRHVLRVSLPERGLPDVLGEMAWLAALDADGVIAVPRPVAARDGSLAVNVATDRVPEPRACAVFGWLDGRRLAENATEPHVEALGEAMARMHAHAIRFPIPEGIGRAWDSPYPYREPEVLFTAAYAEALDGHRAVYERTLAATVSALDRLRRSEAPRMIHADIHEDNVLVRDDGTLAVLDFDDCVAGWPVQDLGVTVWAFASTADLDAKEAALRRGYERVAPWPERETGEVHLFAADTGLSLANLVVQDHDPDYRNEAPSLVARWAERIERLTAER